MDLKMRTGGDGCNKNNTTINPRSDHTTTPVDALMRFMLNFFIFLIVFTTHQMETRRTGETEQYNNQPAQLARNNNKAQ